MAKSEGASTAAAKSEKLNLAACRNPVEDRSSPNSRTRGDWAVVLSRSINGCAYHAEHRDSKRPTVSVWGLLPSLVVLLGGWVASRRYDLRRLDDPFVAAFWFMSVLWVAGLGLGGLYPAAPQLDFPTMALVLFGYAALLAGGMTAGYHRSSGGVGDQPAALARLVRKASQERVLLATVAAGYLAAVAFVAMAGGIPALQPEAEQARIDARAGRGYITIGIIWLVTLPSVALVAAKLTRGPIAWIGIALLTVASALTLAVLGNRAPVMVLAIGVAWVVITRNGQLPSWRLVLPAVGLGLVLLALAAVLRAGEAMTLDLIMSRSMWVLYVNASNLQRLLTFIPSEHSYLFGTSYAMDAAVLLPGPQPNFATWLKDAMQLEFAGGGLTIGLVGELYANFGPAIAVAGMFVAGIALGSIRQRLRVATPLDRAFVILLSMALAGIVQSGILSVLLYQIAPLTALYLLLQYVSKART